ncbi:hypothetical protein [Rathayibacter sp. VKM Ac-2630]|uniref:hypothetical protein n=1 Tax=Rathayibacter sp. VKM Ac-2630 TaxID=1938617 RepID=UPI001F25302C|nr:hypothetical protein [Rathayibacter sp. VKM Ac-2630]
MFVITADQRDSRHDADRVDEVISRLLAERADDLVLRPERTAGDEFQCVLDDPHAVVPLVLELHRSAHWSIGLGIGSVERPLPRTIRAATGQAFFAARRAVESAKGRPARFSLDPDAVRGSFPSIADARGSSIRCCTCATRARMRAGRSSTSSPRGAPRRRRPRSSP